MGGPCWKTLNTSEFWTHLKVRVNLSQKLRKVKIRNTLLFRETKAVMECILAFRFVFSFSLQNLRNKRVSGFSLVSLLWSSLHQCPLHSHKHFKQIHQVFLEVQRMCAYSWMKRWVKKRTVWKRMGGGKHRIHFWVHSTQTCTFTLVFSKNVMSLYTVFIADFILAPSYLKSTLSNSNFKSRVIPLFIQ